MVGSRDTRCWMLDTGYWILDTGYWILDAGWLSGYRILDARCRWFLFVVNNWDASCPCAYFSGWDRCLLRLKLVDSSCAYYLNPFWISFATRLYFIQNLLFEIYLSFEIWELEFIWDLSFWIWDLFGPWFFLEPCPLNLSCALSLVPWTFLMPCTLYLVPSKC